MRSKILLAVILLAVGLGVAASQLGGAFFFTLTGLEEVPVVSTVANAEFTVEIIDSPGTRKRIDYTLFYQNLEGNVTQAHIHVGQEHVNGGISVWLCGNAPLTPPPGTQICPPSAGVVRGTIAPADVVGPSAQGIAAGEFDELIAMMRSGHTYANVHSTKFPGGEVRAQIRLLQNGN